MLNHGRQKWFDGCFFYVYLVGILAILFIFDTDCYVSFGHLLELIGLSHSVLRHVCRVIIVAYREVLEAVWARSRCLHDKDVTRGGRRVPNMSYCVFILLLEGHFLWLLLSIVMGKGGDVVIWLACLRFRIGICAVQASAKVLVLLITWVSHVYFWLNLVISKSALVQGVLILVLQTIVRNLLMLLLR